jgi:hypothetical protein
VEETPYVSIDRGDRVDVIFAGPHLDGAQKFHGWPLEHDEPTPVAIRDEHGSVMETHVVRKGGWDSVFFFNV